MKEIPKEKESSGTCVNNEFLQFFTIIFGRKLRHRNSKFSESGCFSKVRVGDEQRFLLIPINCFLREKVEFFVLPGNFHGDRLQRLRFAFKFFSHLTDAIVP